MKQSAVVISLGLLWAGLLLAPGAGAQPRARASATTPTTPTRTAEYTEHAASGDQVVEFVDDELAAPSGGAYGGSIRRPPGVMRLGLIRPRMNFVAELAKSVEGL